MINFTVSAPNKLSLFGKHIGSYIKKSLTVGINLYTTLKFTELSELCSDGIIQMNFLQIDLLWSIPLQQFLDFYQNCTFNENHNELHDQVLQFITSNRCPFRTEHQRAIAQSFVYLLAYISHKERIDIKPFYVQFSTQLVIDEDSVCLASSIVCLAASLLRWSRLQKGAIDDFDSNDLKKIHSYAASCERISHESGSADCAACTYGQIIYCQFGENLVYIPFYELLNVKILLIDSKQTQNLEAQTQQLIELINTSPEIVDCISKSLDNATKIAAFTLRYLDYLYTHNEFSLETKRLTLTMQHHILQVFINLSQRLLHLLNLSHLHLDKICEIAINHELYAKYADINYGRYAFIWCLPNTSFNRILRLTTELRQNGYDIMETSLACSGVKIL